MAKIASRRDPARPANSLTRALTCLFKRAVRRWYRCSTPETCSRKVWRQPRVGHTRRRTRTRTTTRRPPPAARNVRDRPPVIAVHPSGRGPTYRADRSVPGVRANTTIRSPSSATSSMTSGDSPENTFCTSPLTSSTQEQRHQPPSITTESETGPKAPHSQIPRLAQKCSTGSRLARRTPGRRTRYSRTGPARAGRQRTAKQEQPAGPCVTIPSLLPRRTETVSPSPRK